MSKKVGAYDAGAGKPNLEFLAYLQDTFTADVINRLTNNAVFVTETVISADKTAGIAVDIPLNAKIVDMWVIGTAVSSGGTVTLKTGAASPVTLATALAMAADGTVARLAAGVIHGSLTVGADGIKLFAGQAADRGIVYISYTM